MGLLGPQGAPVPDVVGRDIQDAQQIITEAGFVVGEITPEYSTEVPEGQVIDQSPVANATAEKESAVDLTVSRGPKLVAVPKLIGLKEQQARAALDKAGFVPNPLPDAYSSEFAVGIVFKQTPKAGAKVEEGSEVQYVVSRGKRTVKVPDVRTKSRGAAESTLREAGFKVTVSEASDDRIAAGRVISQSPAAGTEVVEGSTVSIVVSTGPALVEVPDVIGSTEMEARATLENAGFKVEVTYEPHSENGTVLDQDPKNPTKVKPGSTVVIVIDAAEP
jgi:serine/threonine-protein kinase